MKANMGGVDRIIRVVVGVVILALGLIFKSWWGLVGLVPIITGLLGVCLLYVPLHINTRKTASQAPPTGGQQP
jgi:hypothetical protein